jgi:hypothetical protein
MFFFSFLILVKSNHKYIDFIEKTIYKIKGILINKGDKKTPYHLY